MKNEILIPQEWNDVTLGEFIKLSTLDIQNFESEIHYYVEMLRIFGNDNIDDIVEFIKLADISNIVNQMQFIREQPKSLDIKKVTIKGIEYKLMENMNKITIGEYVSIESMMDNKKLNPISAIPAILSVILRPEGEVFNSDLVNTRMELFEKELSIEDVLGMSRFFSTGVKL